MSNSIPITAGTLTYWVGLVGGVVFVSKKDKFVPAMNHGIKVLGLVKDKSKTC